MTSVTGHDCPGRVCIAANESKSETPAERLARLEGEAARLRRELQAMQGRAGELETLLRDTLQLTASVAGVIGARWAASEAKQVAKEIRARLNAIGAVFVQPGPKAHEGLVDPSQCVERLTREIHASHCRPTGVGVRTATTALYIKERTAISLALILVELLANACQHAFTNRSFGTIEVVLEQAERASGRLIVADNGAGLPAAIEANWPQAAQERPNGGLHTALSLARSIGGEITIERGAGTKFVVTFPLRS